MSRTMVTIGFSLAVVGVVAWVLLRTDLAELRGLGPPDAAGSDLASTHPGDETALADAPTTLELQVPATAREPALPGAVYAIRDPDGTVVAGAKVALCAGGEVLASGETGDSGEFETTEDRSELGKLLVLAPRRPPKIREVPMERGRHEVVLDRGAVVSGWIVVNGREPAERIPLVLRSDRTILRIEDELGLTWENFGEHFRTGSLAKTRTEEDGSFGFQGLPDDWRGSLDLPLDYRLADQTLATDSTIRSRLALDGPVQDLQVDVFKRLVLSGRIIDFPKRQTVPVPGAIVQARIESPGIRGGYQGYEVADEEGRFRIALRSPSILGGQLMISPPDQTFTRLIPVEPIELSGNLDLGDLALSAREETQNVRLLVLDADRNPIPDAIAASDATSAFSAPTDSTGRTDLRGVIPGLSTIGVYAAGYEVADVAIPREPPDELTVILRGGTLLELQFLKPDGEVAKGVVARLAASEHPYRHLGRVRSYEAYTRAGCSAYRTVYPPPAEERVVRLFTREGRVTLNDLKTGLPLRLRVEGRYGTTIHEQDIAPLQPQESRRVEIVLTAGPRTLRGIVMDDEGRPLSMASVGVSFLEPDRPAGSARAVSSSVEDDGSFEVRGIYAPYVYLFVTAAGYVDFRDDRFEVPEDGLPIEFRLPVGHVATVFIEDEAGQRLAGTYYLRAESPTGTIFSGRPVEGEVGAFILHDLPDSEVSVRAWVHGAPHTRSLAPDVAELVITLPVMGAVHATVHLFPDSGIDDSWYLCLVPEPDSGLNVRYGKMDVDGIQPTMFDGVLPGRYDAVVRRFPEGTEVLDNFQEMSARVPVQVRAQETAEIEVWPR